MTAQEQWDFLRGLDDAFTRAEKEFGTVGKITVSEEVAKKFYRVAAKEWAPTGNTNGHIGTIWKAEIHLDASLPGTQVILDGVSS
jgi:hypothetical protein